MRGLSLVCCKQTHSGPKCTMNDVPVPHSNAGSIGLRRRAVRRTFRLNNAPLTHVIADIPIAATTLDEATALLLDLTGEQRPRRGLAVHLVNAYTIALSDQSPDYKRVLQDAALCLPDGRPLQWLSRIRAPSPVLRQVRGPSLFQRVLDDGRPRGARHFLLGASPETLACLASRLLERYPGLHPSAHSLLRFGVTSHTDMTEQDQRISAACPDIIWVGRSPQARLRSASPRQRVRMHLRRHWCGVRLRGRDQEPSAGVPRASGARVGVSAPPGAPKALAALPIRQYQIHPRRQPPLKQPGIAPLRPRSPCTVPANDAKSFTATS